eukprot:jgi/Ulvmu1/10131/UM006_0085.1
MDRSAFSSPSFNAKDWINQACTNCPKTEQLDKYLPELEMKVQLASEDAEQRLYEASMLIASRLGSVTSEIVRLRGNLAGMADSVDSLSVQISADERQCSAAASRLQKLHIVKSRMLTAKKTLQEASTLKALYDSLDDIMAKADMPKMLDALATMRSSVDSLVNVPEFVGVSDKVAMLETRVKELSVPKLADAIDKKQDDVVRQVWQALASVDKQDLAQEVYVRHVSITLSTTFQALSSSQAAVEDWLPRWHEQLLQFVAAEQQWLTAVLPQQQPALFLQALSVALKGFVKPVLDSLALPDQAHNPRQLLKTVTFLLSATTRCSTGLRTRFPDTDRAVMSSLAHPLFQPFERFVQKYAELDGIVLNEEVDSAVAVGPGGAAASQEPEVDVDALIAAPRAVEHAARAALDRCEALTASLHLPQLIPVVDGAVARAFATLEARMRALPTGGAASAAAAAPPPHLLRLPFVTAAARRAAAAADAEARRRLAVLAPLAEAAAAGGGDALEAAVRRAVPDQRADVVLWRLSDSPADAEVLSAAQQRMTDLILPKAFAAVGSMEAAVEEVLLALLRRPCKRALEEMSGMSVTWQAIAPDEDLAAAAPYPSAFAMTIGDFLITLPQLLEVLVPEDTPATAADAAGGGDGTLATEWLDRAASSIVEELQRRVLALPKLGSKGSLQLATDLEYICNVVTALGVVLPPPLATACILTGVVPESDFRSTAASGIADGSLDRRAATALAAMRGFSHALS